MGGVKCISLRPEKERENICFFYTAHSLFFHLFSNQENGTFQRTTEGSIIIHFLQHESLHLLPSVFSLDFSSTKHYFSYFCRLEKDSVQMAGNWTSAGLHITHFLMLYSRLVSKRSCLCLEKLKDDE